MQNSEWFIVGAFIQICNFYMIQNIIIIAPHVINLFIYIITTSSIFSAIFVYFVT